MEYNKHNLSLPFLADTNKPTFSSCILLESEQTYRTTQKERGFAMKVVELMYEREKLLQELTTLNKFAFSSEECYGRSKEELSQQTKKDFEESKKLLRRLDTINNILNESDGSTYIEVNEVHISIATARQYLEELKKPNMGSLFPPFGGSTSNARMEFLRDCSFASESAENREDFYDPLQLAGKERYYEKKMLDWEYNLKSAVALSDATTEVKGYFE